MKLLLRVIPISICILVLGQAYGFDHSHSLFNEVLKANVEVSQGGSIVNYKLIKDNPAKLNQYLEKIAFVTKADFKKFTAKEKLAFLINVYNAYTILLIIQNYPVKSIKKLGKGFFGTPWQRKDFSLFGKKYSLDQIEHGMIRKIFNEPRIHFAVNCASIGCPMILNQAFVPSKINRQLQDVTEVFLKDNKRNAFFPKQKLVVLSKIFDWYEKDFKKKSGSVQAFVAPFFTNDPKLLKQFRDEEIDVKYSSYDWNLNEKFQVRKDKTIEKYEKREKSK